MTQSSTLSIGMDVQKDSMAGADVAPAHGAEVTDRGTVGTRQDDLDHLVRQLHSKATHRVLVDDAGPWGSWRSRDLTTKGYHGWVVAPSLLPKKAGDRGNTDRRDAGQLARLRRSGDLTPVSGPTVDDAASRDLARARAETIADLKAANCRLTAVWLRQASRDTGRATWTPAHLRWLSEVVWPTPAPHMGFQAYGRAGTEPTERLQRRDQARHAPVQSWRLPPVVEALQALRGVQCTVAVTAVAALGDLTRVPNPRELLNFLGLIPAEYATGERRRQGARTPAGQTHARRARVEGAWAYRYPAKGSRQLQRRLAKLPNPIPELSWKAPVRLCKRYRRLMARGTQAHQVVVALARDLVGCLWAMAQQVPVTP